MMTTRAELGKSAMADPRILERDADPLNRLHALSSRSSMIFSKNRKSTFWDHALSFLSMIFPKNRLSTLWDHALSFLSMIFPKNRVSTFWDHALSFLSMIFSKNRKSTFWDHALIHRRRDDPDDDGRLAARVAPAERFSLE